LRLLTHFLVFCVTIILVGSFNISFSHINRLSGKNKSGTAPYLFSGSAREAAHNLTGAGQEPPSPSSVSRKQIIGQLPGGGFGAAVSGAREISGDGRDDFIWAPQTFLRIKGEFTFTLVRLGRHQIRM